jgi:hypothetical protein
MKEEEIKALEEKYTPEIVKKVGELGQTNWWTWRYGFYDGLEVD